MKKIIPYILIKLKLVGLVKYIQLFLINVSLEEPKPRIGVYPYLSGDAFLALSDIAYLKSSKNPIYLRNNNNPRICFIEIDVFNQLDDISSFSIYKVIILHNGDSPVDLSKVRFFAEKGIKVFAVNLNHEIDNVTTIPIGLENSHLARNGSLHFFNPLTLAERLNKNNLLLVSFSIETNFTKRTRVSNICSMNGYKNNQYSLNDYREKLIESYFVISPPGNGIDCHRTWEACYLKCVPIIEKKDYLFNHVNLPILIVDDYHDFFALTHNQKMKLYLEITSSESSAIYMDWWAEKIRNSLSSFRTDIT
tara:strand:- start:348 stop:1268 length:921 start_codon:yes stop_codon:yes gene_type:complete